MITKKVIRKLLVAGGALVLANASQAAVVTWTTDATETTSVNDIDLSGTLEYAGTFGSAQQSVVVGSETIVFADSTVSATGPADAIGTSIGEVSRAAIFVGDTGSTQFNAVMDSFTYANSSLALTLGGLTTGDKYQIQLFVSDDRELSVRTQNWSDNVAAGVGNETTVVQQRNSSYVIGTFTADATGVQTVYGLRASSPSANLNGYVLRAIPEPATLGLVGAFDGGILFIRRRFMI